MPLGPCAASSTTFTSSEFGNQLKNVKFKPLKLEVSKCVSNSQKDPKQWKNQIIQNWPEPTSLVQLKEHRNIRSKCSPDGITVRFPHKLHGYMFNLLKTPMFSIVFIHSFPFTIGFSQFLPCFPHENPQKNIRGLRCFPNPPRRPSPSCRTWSATANRSGNACAPRWNRTRLGKKSGEMCLWENGQLVGGWWLMVNDG